MSISTPKHYSSAVFAITSAILMATIGVFSKYIGLSAATITCFRLLGGAFFMVLFLLLQGKISLLAKRPSAPVIVNGFFLAGFIIFYVQAMNHTTMANAIMLVYFAPLFSAVIAHFFMKERLRLFSIALIIFAILGFAMMLEFKLDLQGDKERTLGMSFAFLAMLCYSGFILVNRKISDHVFTSTFYQLLVGGTVLVPVVFYSYTAITMQQSFLLAAVGFFPGFLGILLAVVALRHLNTASFGTLAYFEPLSVVLFGWLIFGERLSALQMVGCFIILSCGIIKVITDTKTEKTQLA